MPASTPLAFSEAGGVFVWTGLVRKGCALKLRYLPLILLEIVFWAIAIWITKLLLAWGIPHIPAWVWAFCRRWALAESALDVILKLLAYSVCLFIVAQLHKIFHALRSQDSPANAPQGKVLVRKPPPPPQTLSAEIIGKRIKTKRHPRERHPTIRHFLGFRLPDGQEVWFPVSEEEYRRLSEGDRGVLDVQGKVYRSFRLDREAQFPAPGGAEGRRRGTT